MKMLESYGGHAQKVIPELEQTAEYFENEEEDFPKKLSLNKARIVRETIAKIQASKDKPKLTGLNFLSIYQSGSFVAE